MLTKNELTKIVLEKENVLNEAAEFFRIFGDATRLKILSSIQNQELCVCDIASVVTSSQSAVSHQLRMLRNLKVVKSRKVGKEVFYSLDDEHIDNILKQGLEHVKE